MTLSDLVIKIPCARAGMECTDRAKTKRYENGPFIYHTKRCGICGQICCINVGNCDAVGVVSAMPLPRIKVASQAASLLLVP